jgi:pseudolysin
MDKQKKLLSGMMLLATPLMAGSLYAATAVDLSHQPVSALKAFAPSGFAAATQSASMQEINRNVDFKKTMHVRLQQTYMGYPVWGGEAIMHIPAGTNTPRGVNAVMNAGLAKNNTSMTGTFFQGLNTDLASAPANLLSKDATSKALLSVKKSYESTRGEKVVITQDSATPLVYMTDAGKAVWAYKISFYVAPTPKAVEPAKPVYIVDAITGQVYQQWNDVKTLDNVDGGGFGGNTKMGELDYDGLPANLAKLSVERDSATNKCYLENTDVVVKNYSYFNQKVASFDCLEPNMFHNNVFWDADMDAVNGGYSPQNDAMFAGQVIKHMYQDWYHVPVLTKNGQPMLLQMVVHVPKYDNAYWDPNAEEMVFGDGEDLFYPLTSLGVGAHEISHGFTTQHSNLTYTHQSGGMNEAFSDMAAQAAELYAYGKNSWQIGPEIFKQEGRALRYMDQPSKDGRSIDDASQYKSSLDVHYTSGVYNRLFYLMGTAPGSDAHKAFDVMVQAQNYWTANATYETGACGVLKAAADVGFSVDVVKSALDTVKINYSKC